MKGNEMAGRNLAFKSFDVLNSDYAEQSPGRNGEEQRDASNFESGLFKDKFQIDIASKDMNV